VEDQGLNVFFVGRVEQVVESNTRIHGPNLPVLG
jgi:hypothetical protein